MEGFWSAKTALYITAKWCKQVCDLSDSPSSAHMSNFSLTDSSGQYISLLLVGYAQIGYCMWQKSRNMPLC